MAGISCSKDDRAVAPARRILIPSGVADEIGAVGLSVEFPPRNAVATIAFETAKRQKQAAA